MRHNLDLNISLKFIFLKLGVYFEINAVLHLGPEATPALGVYAVAAMLAPDLAKTRFDGV